MRQATRMIKDILKLRFPDKEFHLKNHKTKDDVEKFDKLIIVCEDGTDLDEVIAHIRKYVSGIVVYKYGQPVPPIDRERNKVMSIATYSWIEMDVLEFIEVR